MKIVGFIWLEEIVEKLAAKHQVILKKSSRFSTTNPASSA